MCVLTDVKHPILFSVRSQLFWTTFHLRIIAAFSPTSFFTSRALVIDAAYLKRVFRYYLWGFFSKVGTLLGFWCGHFLDLARRILHSDLTPAPGKAEPLPLPGVYSLLAQRLIMIKKECCIASYPRKVQPVSLSGHDFGINKGFVTWLASTKDLIPAAKAAPSLGIPHAPPRFWPDLGT